MVPDPVPDPAKSCCSGALAPQPYFEQLADGKKDSDPTIQKATQFELRSTDCLTVL